MQIAELSPELAAAADVLSDRLRDHLQQLAVLLAPHAEALDRRFTAKLTQLGFHSKARSALVTLTTGAAARLLARGMALVKFIEQVEYSGRRLAKLNLPPGSVLQAFAEYDRLLQPILKKLIPEGDANFHWVREQLHFCVVLTLNNAYYQVREAETEAFYELFRAELEAHSLDELLRRFLATLSQFSRADAARLYLENAPGGPWMLRAACGIPAGVEHSNPIRPSTISPNAVNMDARRMSLLSRPRHILPSRAGSSELLLDASWSGPYRSCWSIPFAAGGRIAGVLQFAFSKSYEWLPRERELLSAAAERCLLAAEKARLMEDLAAREEQIRSLAEHMLHVEEMERRRISRELHDEAGQSLLCMRLQMEMLEHMLPAGQTEWIGRLREVRDLAERTILEMRRLIAALSPAVLEQLGLGAALRQLVNRLRRLNPIRVRLHMTGIDRLPQATEVIIYRLVQECFNNIAKHSQASAVNISVSSADGTVKLNVDDNGIGFLVDEAFARRDSFGLAGMRERVALLGGKFNVRSTPRKGMPSASGDEHRKHAQRRSGGTRIQIVLPVAADAESDKRTRRPWKFPMPEGVSREPSGIRNGTPVPLARSADPAVANRRSMGAQAAAAFKRVRLPVNNGGLNSGTCVQT